MRKSKRGMVFAVIEVAELEKAQKQEEIKELELKLN